MTDDKDQTYGWITDPKDPFRPETSAEDTSMLRHEELWSGVADVHGARYVLIIRRPDGGDFEWRVSRDGWLLKSGAKASLVKALHWAKMAIVASEKHRVTVPHE